MAYKIYYLDGHRELVYSMEKVLAHLGEIEKVEASPFPASRQADYTIMGGGR